MRSAYHCDGSSGSPTSLHISISSTGKSLSRIRAKMRGLRSSRLTIWRGAEEVSGVSPQPEARAHSRKSTRMRLFHTPEPVVPRSTWSKCHTHGAAWAAWANNAKCVTGL